jgi:ABC-type multidrug transport system fused ATPase/permease subunit
LDILAIVKTLFCRIATEQDILTYATNYTTDGTNYRNAIEDRDKMIWLFPIVLVTVATATLLKAALYYHFTKKASLSLHRLLSEKVLNASLFFFSDHYVGNILNRFSEDLLYIDEIVSYSLYIVLEVEFYVRQFF